MDIVIELEKANKTYKSTNDFNIFIETLKNESTDKVDPSRWRWDVLKSIVSEDKELLSLVISEELSARYSHFKKSSSDVCFPSLIRIAVMAFHSHYKLYKDYVDVVQIQKDVFGSEIFAQIETAMNSFLYEHYSLILTKYIPDGFTQVSFIDFMYKTDKLEFKNYYYWSTIESVYDDLKNSLISIN